MAVTVGFISEKGGVGKTTACYHIAIALRRYHSKRVLVVDTDYQRGGLTCRLVPELLEHFRTGTGLPGTTLFDKFQQLYSGAASTPDVDQMDTSVGVTLIPADPRLSQVTVDKLPSSNNIRENTRSMFRHLSLLRSLIDPIVDDYDYVLIDSHPELSDLLRTVVYACEFCVSPVKLDRQSAIGVPSAQEAINEVNADLEMIRGGLGPSAIPTRPATTFAGAMGMMAREWGGMLKSTERVEYRRLQMSSGIFENYVTEGDGLRQAAAARCPVFDINGANAEKQTGQFIALTQEFITRCH